MELYVLRHAIAVERGSKGYADDSERPLTPKGIAKMRQGARGIASMRLDFDLILSSPYVRARETAEIVAEALRAMGRLELFGPLAGEVPADEALRQIAHRTEGCSSVLLVGHEPQLSQLGSILLAGSPNLALPLKKGGLFKLDCPRLHPGDAILGWWLTPRQLRKFSA